MSHDANPTTTPPTPTAAEVLAAAPAVRREPGARDRIRAANTAAGRRIAVLDDDPTGSQTVHDVSVVTVLRGRRNTPPASPNPVRPASC